MITKIAATVSLTYIDFKLRLEASFLYFFDKIDKFCAFESSSEKDNTLIIF